MKKKFELQQVGEELLFVIHVISRCKFVMYYFKNSHPLRVFNSFVECVFFSFFFTRYYDAFDDLPADNWNI